MGLKKGQTNNPGGRPKGAKNKVTREVKEVIKSITSEYFNNGSFDKDFKRLDPKDRVQVIERLLKYHIPTLSSVDAKVYSNQELEEKVGQMTNEQFLNLVDEVMNLNEEDQDETK
ncbi:hypothetical protein H8B06_18695 [Sphingobacterium sp. DN00404]|uniref:DUF5681 domain-containing protein n=1 Tax=Sphingobacterium micropteri TaxID=2763501 RepID=A0ABR7YU47_9SPHI|nr:hypothetical protein [Sphingobacterium micropteri]MBD1434859.1 hypothetical protein [Sphingobacterium micropteri]